METPRLLPFHNTQAPDGIAEGEGLLHDVRNLTGALGLYCDLLALPGVLKPEHAHYADELRVLGTRSGKLMERLALSLPDVHDIRQPTPEVRAQAGKLASPVNLREIVDRCSGLLGQVAGGRTIELSYGPAASSLVLVAQEDVERILVNLVRNAAAALDARGRPASKSAVGAVREIAPDRTADATPDAIRISVGLLQNQVGDPRPFPFRRVRLTVEDSGSGMSSEQVERLLRVSQAPLRGSRGIGFCVVRELVAAGDGELRMMSAPGMGTRVQIEWPVAMSGALIGAESTPVRGLAIRESWWSAC